MHTDSQNLKAENQVGFLSFSFILKRLMPYACYIFSVIKRKSIPVTGRGGEWGCETSRLSHFVDSRSQMATVRLSALRFCSPPFTPKEDSWYSFLLEDRLSAAGKMRSIEQSNDLIGNRTRDLLVGTVVPLPTTQPRAPIMP
jgi:hypothetical protein